MGAIGGMVGLSGGAAGTGFAAPGLASLLQGTDEAQAGIAWTRNQQALDQQQRLVDALRNAGGLQKQEDYYKNLQNIASGQGPNPAQAMLNQQTGANIASQAALMAGQRGVGANTGLLARQAAMQGGNLQQQAVGQGAIMQANQAMNAINSMGGLANTQVANQIGATNAYTQAQQALHGNIMNAIAAQNNARVGNQSSVNSANSALAQTQMQGQQALIGGLMNGGGAASMMGGGGGGAGGAGMMAAMSDENQKTNIQNADADVKRFLEAMQAHKYNYKPSAEIDNKKHISPMAQELEQSGVGKELVSQGPKGKMIEYNKAGPAILSSLAYLHKEIESLKGGNTSQMAMGGVAEPAVQQGAASSFGQFLTTASAAAPSPMVELSHIVGPNPGAEELKKGMTGATRSLMSGSSTVDPSGKTTGGYAGANLGVNTRMPAPQMPQQMQPAPTSQSIGAYNPSISQPTMSAYPNQRPGPSLLQAKGGLVPIMVSPGEKIISPENVSRAAKGEVVAETVPGKAKVKGDSYDNDTVKMEAKPGTVVVKRTKAKNDRDAASFVRSVLAKRGRK